MALIIVLAGFFFAHARSANVPVGYTSAATGASAVPVRRKLDGTVAYSLDVVAHGSVSTTFGGNVRRSVTIAMPQDMTISGWAIDDHARASADSIAAEIDDRAVVAGVIGSARPDVAKAYGVDAYGNSGFIVVLPKSDLKSGTHSIDLRVYSHAGDGFYVDPGVLKVTVR